MPWNAAPVFGCSFRMPETKKARPVRQQWLFDDGLVDHAPFGEWRRDSIDQIATLGS